MRRPAGIGLICAALCTPTDLASAQTAGPPHPPPTVEIPGTLDPTTGKFTPDVATPSTAPIAVSGDITVKFDIDPVARKTTSLFCKVEVTYVEDSGDGPDGLPVASEGVRDYALKYDSETNRFNGTSKAFHYNLNTDYVDEPDTKFFSSGILISCFYLDKLNTPVFTSTYVLRHLKPGGDYIFTFKGSMRD